MGVFIIFALEKCSDVNEGGTSNRPGTIFDNAPPGPRSDQIKIDDFVVALESRYKRESLRNAIDLHFSKVGSNQIKIRVGYDRTANPTTANSIADAAVELAKRLKREDPELRNIDVTFERVVEPRRE